MKTSAVQSRKVGAEVKKKLIEDINSGMFDLTKLRTLRKNALERGGDEVVAAIDAYEPRAAREHDRRPNIDLYNHCECSYGDVLTDPKSGAKITVLSNRTVAYAGVEFHLTPLEDYLRQLGLPVARNWIKEDGRSLNDLYNAKIP